MNFSTRTLVLFLFLDFTELSSTEGSAAIKSSEISSKGARHANVTIGNTRSKNNPSTSLTDFKFQPHQKWKIGRVTSKQYGIINILWQKTKIFVDQDYSDLTCKATTIEMTANIQKQNSSERDYFKIPINPGKLQTSTLSYIEFYYLDHGDDRVKRKHSRNTLNKFKKGKKTNVDRPSSSNLKSPNPSLLKIPMNTVRDKHAPQLTKSDHKVGQGNFYRNKLHKSRRTTFVSKTRLTVTSKAKVRNSKQPQKNRLQQTISIVTKSTPVIVKATRHERKVNKGNNNLYTTKFVNGTTNGIKSFLIPGGTTAAYDKVKFFELYDNNTPKRQNLNSNLSYDNNSINRIQYDKQVLLHHVNEHIGHHQVKNKTRYVKKHIQDLYKKEGKFHNEMNISRYLNSRNLKFSLNTSKLQVPLQKNYNWSRPTTWTEFPFVAVYIYEPAQVHCDAAGISPHWLVAAASCLSRHRKGLRGGGLSAFVSFCGDNWKYPQMISYVKRTIIHPLYHPKDRLRRLFNAGLVQVVNSMADTCGGWAPISLMSHQYTTDEKGSLATAIGWGLDRYAESYATINIPQHPLMIFEGPVYSETCPESSEYSEAKRSDEVGISNVYCLLLPPYLAEENDTVHGALLLIGGKLLALYLKEERRPWGVQSAQYASIWRLLPWLAETAREPEEPFQFEI